MTTYGVTETGFVKKPLSVIRQEIKDELLNTIGSELNLLDSSVLGQIEGVFSDKLREAWDVMEAVYASQYRDSASDASLDNVGAITGTTRLASQKSTVTLDQLYVDSGTTIPSGSIVSVGASGARFVTTAAVTNSSATASATISVAAESEDYGEIQGYAGTIDTIQTPVSGWDAKAAITGTNSETFSLDGTSIVLQVDENGSDQTVNFSGGNPWSASSAATEINDNTSGIDAYDDGDGKLRIGSDTDGTGSSIRIVSGSALTVLGFTAGLTKGFNSEDADIGREIETDPEFRVRQDSVLRSTGSATVEAIRAGLLLEDDVEQAFVIENVEDVISAEGIPPHSVEAVILGGDGQTLADTLWTELVAGGIRTYGNTSYTVTDTMGFDHTVKFSRPDEIALTLTYTLTVDSDLYPSDGDDQVKAAVVAYAETLELGEDAIALQFESVPLSIAGVIDVTAFTINGGTSNIAISFRQLATADTGDITVTS
jgi:hypothetical protein